MTTISSVTGRGVVVSLCSLRGPLTGYDGDLWFPPQHCIPMFTAMSWLLTPEGFAIAADGRRTNDRCEVESDRARKIFDIQGSGLCLAYGLAATTAIGRPGGDPIFDFVAEVPMAFERLASNLPKNWFEYLSALTSDLQQRINEARLSSGASLLSSPREMQTYLFVGGVYGKHLKCGHLSFRHLPEATEAEPHIYQHGFVPPPFGSDKILEALLNGDARLAQYAEPQRNRITSLTKAVERASNDILAHCDPIAADIDQEISLTTGGRPHAATVTRSAGFQWVPGFEYVP